MAYRDSMDHLQDELARVELLLRAETAKAAADDLTAAEHREAAAVLAERIAKDVEASEVSLRLPALVRWFGLDDHERDIVVLCLLAELDKPARGLLESLDGGQEGGPTVHLALRVLAPELAGTPRVWTLFSLDRPLLGDRLLTLGTEDALRLDPAVARHLLGYDGIADHLRPVLAAPATAMTLDELVLAPTLRQTLRRLAPVMGEHAVLLLHGPPGAGRRSVAGALCHAAGMPLLLADVPTARTPDWPQTVVECYREAGMRGAALCWVNAGPLFDDAAQLRVLLAAADRFPAPTILTAERAWDPATETPAGFLRVAVPAPDFGGRAELWRRSLPGVPDETVHRLANTFRFTPGKIRNALGAALGVARLRDPLSPTVTEADLAEGCRRQCARGLAAAHRVPPRTETTFDDLVLPGPNRRQLRELADHITLRGRLFGELGFGRRIGLGRGVVALFSGGPGTGKTMAAELLAREQGIDLYKVDIAAVASRWVGETEKHLDQLFTDAEQANVMLFFDEADALFAQRGEIKEARDRWANVEMSFLLQRIEEFEGVVILATNLRQNIDKAFFRRLHAVVDFPLPEADYRQRIWRGMFPPELTHPGEGVLADLAARFPLSGGDIRNAVLDAAVRALSADPQAAVVSTRDLVVSIAREYQKTGRVITPAVFGAEFHRWAEDALFATTPSPSP